MLVRNIKRKLVFEIYMSDSVSDEEFEKLFEDIRDGINDKLKNTEYRIDPSNETTEKEDYVKAYKHKYRIRKKKQ